MACEVVYYRKLVRETGLKVYGHYLKPRLEKFFVQTPTNSNIVLLVVASMVRITPLRFRKRKDKKKKLFKFVLVGILNAKC